MKLDAAKLRKASRILVAASRADLPRETHQTRLKPALDMLLDILIDLNSSPKSPKVKPR